MPSTVTFSLTSEALHPCTLAKENESVKSPAEDGNVQIGSVTGASRLNAGLAVSTATVTLGVPSPVTENEPVKPFTRPAAGSRTTVVPSANLKSPATAASDSARTEPSWTTKYLPLSNVAAPPSASSPAPFL